MSNDIATFDQRNVRGTDSNSLLRMYDRACEVAKTAELQHERKTADKALRRIVKELEKRKVPFRTGHDLGVPAKALEVAPVLDR